MLSKLPPLRNGQPTADWCMAVAEFLDALQTTTGGGGFRSGVTIDQTGMSFQEYDKSVFLATITGRSGSAYAWTRLVSSTGGVNGTDGYGAAGTTSYLPAYHVTGATSIANGTVVLMWPADSENEMRFVNGLDPSNLIDLSGRSGSIADVTALQILRGVISGTAGAAVFTPDDATETLPGDWKAAATQTLAGGKTINRYTALTGPVVSIGNNGVGSTTDPSFYAEGAILIGNQPTGYDPAEALALYYDEATGFSLIQHTDSSGGTSIDMREALAGVSASGGVVSIGGTAPTFYCRVIQASLKFKVGAGAGTDGATATDAIGNQFTGGILTTGSGANLASGGSVAFTGDISPAQLTANTNDWAPTGWS